MSIFNNRLNQVLSTSQYVLNSKYPDEFELYMCALELVSVKTGKTLSYFVFPVMPSSEDFTSTTTTNVQNTFGGVSVLSTTNFVPFDINLSGSFGRSFKLSVGNTFFELTSIVSNISKLRDFSTLSQFDPKLKSGYGYSKMLEILLDEAKSVDSDGQRVLYLYNLAFNQKYVVEVVDMNFKQDLNTNMIWNYKITLKAVAPLSLVSSFHSDSNNITTLSKSLSKSSVVNNVYSKLLNVVRTIL